LLGTPLAPGCMLPAADPSPPPPPQAANTAALSTVKVPAFAKRLLCPATKTLAVVPGIFELPALDISELIASNSMVVSIVWGMISFVVVTIKSIVRRLHLRRTSNL
jgi:hypothetical protein